MNWNNCEFEASLLMVELQEGVAFYDSPIGLPLGLTNVDASPMLQEPNVKDFIKSFEKFGTRVGLEIDNPVPLLLDRPGVFITPGDLFTRQEVLDSIEPYLTQPYTPYLPDFYTLGFFPSRPGSPVREITKDGKVYQDGNLIATEGVSNPPEWALSLVEDAQQYCGASYNHYKVSTDGQTKKAYIYTNNLYA